MINAFWSFRNRIDFTLRNWVHWHRRGLTLEKRPTERVFKHLTAEQKEAAQKVEASLLRRYDLKDVAERGGSENYCINLYYLNLLETTFNQINYCMPDPIMAADIGCSSWFYVRALVAFLERWKSERRRQVQLIGYEVDAFQPYLNFYTRYDYALAYKAACLNADYVSAPFQCQPGRFDLIFQFFPFIFERNHLEWGLPGNLFSPLALLSAAWDSLKPGGVLLVTNQGIKEHEAQLNLFKQVGITADITLRVSSPVYHYKMDHYASLGIKR